MLLSILFVPMGTYAKDLDEIQDYEIVVDNYEDGSLEIHYHIDWKVLDSTTEGALNWVKIGIPNRYVEEMIPQSDTISKIAYLRDGGDYVRIDLDRDYYAGEVVTIDFSIHQHQMYKDQGGYYEFSFTPGWFEDIRIDTMKIFWMAKEGMDSSMEQAGDYFIEEERDLQHGEQMSVVVFYNQPEYEFLDDYRDQVRHRNDFAAGIFSVVIFMVIPVCILFYLFLIKRMRPEKDYYTAHSGMGRYYYHNHVVRSGHSGGHSGGCACACACACAGGGRAGCSVKEFYGAKKWQIHKSIADNHTGIIAG